MSEAELLAVPELLDLGSELLLLVLAHLGPRELVRVAATCRALSALARDDGLWRAICTRRWHNVHHAPRRPPSTATTATATTANATATTATVTTATVTTATAATATASATATYCSLYAANNGWSKPRIASGVIRAAKEDEFISAVLACSTPQGGASHVALATGSAVELWGLRAEGEGVGSRLLGSHAILPGAIVHSLAMPSPHLVLTGDNWGALEVLQLQQQHEQQQEGGRGSCGAADARARRQRGTRAAKTILF